jgi:two-component system CheB/CheR fusion protein
MASDKDNTAGPPVGFEKASVPFPVVGIGASAGGVQALNTFFQHMPSGSGMAFVVILHLSPTHESHVDEILQNVTSMPVLQVNEPTPIRPDHIYVIPPNRDLQMADGYLKVTEPAKPRPGRQAVIDLFFRTLAHAHKAHAIAVVLSGTGSDGAVGLRTVKEQGGIAIAQLPADAQYDTMPRNAIGTGVVDFVLPAEEIPQRVIQLWRNAQHIVLPPTDPAPPTERQRLADESLREILVLLRSRTGHDFLQYKRATILRRIERRLQINQLVDLPTYAAFLRDHLEETPLLMRDLLISVTNFFRDHAAFEALERTVVPALFQGRAPDEQIRVWVPGCATGEEAYSIAMLLIEHARDAVAPPPIQVFATDIDEEALAFGRGGLYPRRSWPTCPRRGCNDSSRRRGEATGFTRRCARPSCSRRTT